MPVQVTIPTTIRTDAPTLLQRPGELIEALAAAAGRALAHANEVVMAPRGGYVAVTLHAPAFTWRGAGLEQLSLARRAEFEVRLGAVLADLVREAGILQWAEEASELPTPLCEEPESSANDPGYVQILRRYLLPTYDQAGVRRPVPVQRTRTPARMRLEVGTWFQLVGAITSQRTIASFRRAVAEAMQRFEGMLPTSGYVGFMFMRHPEIQVWIYHLPESDAAFNLHWPPRPHRHLQVQGNDLHYVGDSQVYPVGVYSLRLVKQSPNHQELVDAWQEWVMDYVREEARSALGDKISLLTKDDFETAVAELAREVGGPEIGNDITALIEFKGNEITDLIPMKLDISLPDNFGCPVYPLASWNIEEVTLGGGGTGEGQGGEGSQGQQGAPGGAAGGGGEAETAPVGYPGIYRGGSELVCQPFEGEPSLDDLGQGAETVRQLINDIAAQLQINTCNYAGWFSMNAAVALGVRARGLSEFAAYSAEATTVLRPAGDEGKNLGFVHFVPIASPAILLLRRLASVTPLLTRLSHEIDLLYHAHQEKFPAGLSHWQIEFHPQLVRETKFSVADLFLATCRVLMLQLLRTSYQGIQGRLNNIDQYAPIFEQMVVNQLTRLDDLLQLRRDLQDERMRRNQASIGEIVAIDYNYLTNPRTYWRDMARQMNDLLNGTVETVGGQERYLVINGQLHVRDASGRVWSMEQLERAIAIQRGTAEDIDPLVKQLRDIPGMMDRFRADRRMIRPELERLLREMTQHNLKQQGRVMFEPEYAFESGRISANAAQATVPGTGYDLQGIHLEAHRQIGEFFRGDVHYNFALGMLLRNEDDTRTFTMVAEFVGIILLSVICAPLGAAAGVLAAGYHYSQALEKQALYQALIDPEALISYAEVEAELFAARLGLALAFIPEVGSILRTGSYGVRAAARAGVVGGVRIVGRYVARRLTAEIIENLARNLLLAFAKEVMTALVLQQVIEALFQPIMAQVEHEFLVIGSVGGSAGADAILRLLEQQHREGIQ